MICADDQHCVRNAATALPARTSDTLIPLPPFTDARSSVKSVRLSFSESKINGCFADDFISVIAERQAEKIVYCVNIWLPPIGVARACQANQLRHKHNRQPCLIIAVGQSLLVFMFIATRPAS